MSMHSTMSCLPALQVHKCPRLFRIPNFSSPVTESAKSTYLTRIQKKSWSFRCSSGKEEDYLLDAPVSVGDGFSFSGGKYADGSSPADEWFKQGKMVKAYAVGGSGQKAKDPIFGLTMGSSSQASDDVFRVYLCMSFLQQMVLC